MLRTIISRTVKAVSLICKRLSRILSTISQVTDLAPRTKGRPGQFPYENVSRFVTHSNTHYPNQQIHSGPVLHTKLAPNGTHQYQIWLQLTPNPKSCGRFKFSELNDHTIESPLRLGYCIPSRGHQAQQRQQLRFYHKLSQMKFKYPVCEIISTVVDA